jgi:glycosyltransferase involved in cell wall biosynthesis
MDISIVIPLYNEQDNIQSLFNQLKDVIDKLHKDCEIIFVDDGSADNSFTILKELHKSDPIARIIRLDKNCGKSSALDAGIRNAKGNLVITMDADLQISPYELIKVIKELNNYDVVLGWRSNRAQTDGFVKFFSSKVANFVRNIILKENFKDTGCSLRGFRKQCLENVTPYKDFEIFIPSLMNMLGYHIKEIKIQTYPRKFGHSKYNIRNRLWKAFIALFIAKWMQRNRIKYRIFIEE